jgi:hypothetical protein
MSGHSRTRLGPLAAALFVLFTHTTTHAGDKTYLQELIQQAKQQGLAQQAQWLHLLHYRSRLIFSGVISEVDDPDFFIHPNGKYDPQAEMAATLEAFFSDAPWGKKEEPAQCAFIARYEWLKAQLQFDPLRMKKYPCAEFERWYTGINPGSVTLVFPSAYLNNPSSMFGHTLLRVDPPGKGQETPLLSYVINYGADTGDDGGIVFAFKGIFGGYPGYVGIGPYYKKVKEYSDTESRDIWEYQLNLNQEETRRMLAHVWELRGVYFEYYFFDENCSYLVLELLDVARPKLNLSQQFSGWVIPSDTLRQVTQQPGLVEKIVYRPAAETKLLYAAQQLSSQGQVAAKALAEGRLTLEAFLNDQTLQPEQGDILLLAHDYLRYEFLAGRNEREGASHRSREILIARSKLSSSPPPLPPRPKTSPEEGHQTAMLQWGIGREDGEGVSQLKIRPAYHDLLDNDDGYIPGAQIDFFNLGLLYRGDREKLLLDSLTLLDIVSLTPRSRFIHPLSWHIRTGWERRILPDIKSPDRPSYYLEAGGGLTTKIAKNVLLFGFMDMAANSDKELEQGYAAGAGLQFGLLAQASPSWKIKLHAKDINYRLGEAHNFKSYGVTQRYALSQRHALDFHWQREQAFGLYNTRYTISWRWYW